GTHLPHIPAGARARLPAANHLRRRHGAADGLSAVRADRPCQPQGHVVEMIDTPVLRLKGVNKRFGGVVAANDVDLDLPPGIITTLVGPNGAGKTTLFNLITGNLSPDSGRIELRGQSL